MHALSLAAALLTFAALLATTPPAAAADTCHATLSGTELKIGNARVERRWRLAKGLLYPVSFRDLSTGVEWLTPSTDQPAPNPAAALTATDPVAFTSRRGRLGPIEAESCIAELAIGGAAGVRYRFQIFPDSPGISVQLLASPASAAAGETPAAPAASGVENDRAAAAKTLRDVVDALPLAPQHLRLTQVNLLDQTDIHNELVFEREWLLHPAERIRIPGNLLVIENTLTHSGLILLKEAPLPHARPIRTEYDFDIDPGRRRAALLGTAYRGIVLAYSGGRPGITLALQQYQRQLRPYDARRDAMFLSNTWGDRSRDARINAAFMQQEIDAGARLGVDVIQIDDGWQHGRTANSASGGGVWNGFWAADPNFWQVNTERFPQGLDPLVKRARQFGMQFGLWFAPDSSHDFANWQRDADALLGLWRTRHVRYFKIDGVKSTTPKSEQNLRRFFERVLSESKGEITFDLDVTAEIRPGYFGSMDTGPLFVENRYTDWHRYWPHQTLRNLWKLAHYVDPLRLRMEFLNNTRNQKQYPDDPLAPSRYSPAYLFATTMFANPLGWFEMSNLPAAYFEQLPPLIATWKRHRAAIFGGAMLPIGDAPDGTAWTGFVSLSPDRTSGHILLFREENDRAQATVSVPLVASGNYRIEVLGGAGSARLQGGAVTATLPQPRSFLWVRFSR